MGGLTCQLDSTLHCGVLNPLLALDPSECKERTRRPHTPCWRRQHVGRRTRADCKAHDPPAMGAGGRQPRNLSTPLSLVVAMAGRANLRREHGGGLVMVTRGRSCCGELLRRAGQPLQVGYLRSPTQPLLLSCSNANALDTGKTARLSRQPLPPTSVDAWMKVLLPKGTP